MYYAILNGMCYAHYLAAHPLGYGIGVWGLCVEDVLVAMDFVVGEQVEAVTRHLVRSGRFHSGMSALGDGSWNIPGHFSPYGMYKLQLYDAQLGYPVLAYSMAVKQFHIDAMAASVKARLTGFEQLGQFDTYQHGFEGFPGGGASVNGGDEIVKHLLGDQRPQPLLVTIGKGTQNNLESSLRSGQEFVNIERWIGEPDLGQSSDQRRFISQPCVFGTGVVQTRNIIADRRLGRARRESVFRPLFGACPPPQHAAQAQNQEYGDHGKKKDIQKTRTLTHGAAPGKAPNFLSNAVLSPAFSG